MKSISSRYWLGQTFSFFSLCLFDSFLKTFMNIWWELCFFTAVLSHNLMKNTSLKTNPSPIFTPTAYTQVHSHATQITLTERHFKFSVLIENLSKKVVCRHVKLLMQITDIFLIASISWHELNYIKLSHLEFLY